MLGGGANLNAKGQDHKLMLRPTLVLDDGPTLMLRARTHLGVERVGGESEGVGPADVGPGCQTRPHAHPPRAAGGRVALHIALCSQPRVRIPRATIRILL